MGDQHQTHAGFPLKLFQKGQNLGLNRHVKRRGRLIGNQDIRLQHQGHGDHQPLALAAGKLVRILVQRLFRLRNSDPCDKLKRPGARLIGRAAVGGHRLDDLPADGVDRVEVAEGVLENHRDALAVQRTMLFIADLQEVLPTEQDFTGHDMRRGHVQKVHHRRRGHRFSRPAFTQNGKGFAAPDAPRHVLDRMHGPACGMKIHRQVADFKQGVTHRSCSWLQGATAGRGQGPHASSLTQGSMPAWWRQCTGPARTRATRRCQGTVVPG